MTTRHRIVARSPSVSGGGPGGGVTANVVWGPQFGEVDELVANARITMPEVALDNTKTVAVNLTGSLDVDLTSAAVQLKVGANLKHDIEIEYLGSDGLLEVNAVIDGDLHVDLTSTAVTLKANSKFATNDLLVDLTGAAVQLKTGVHLSFEDLHIDWLNDNPTAGIDIPFYDLHTDYLNDVPASGVHVTMPELALEGQIGGATDVVGVHLSGTARGAPNVQNTVSQTTSAAGGLASIAISQPAGTVIGDLLIVFVATHRTGNQTTDTPAGWTLIQANNATTVTGAAFYKIATVDGSVSYDFTFSGAVGVTDIAIAVLHRINGHDGTTPINASANDIVAVADLVPDPVNPSVTTTVGACRVFAFLAHDHAAVSQGDNAHATAAGHVERLDEEQVVSGVTFTALHDMDKVFSAAAATGTVTHNCSETVGTNGVMVRVAIAPGDVAIAA